MEKHRLDRFLQEKSQRLPKTETVLSGRPGLYSLVLHYTNAVAAITYNKFTLDERHSVIDRDGQFC